MTEKLDPIFNRYGLGATLIREGQEIPIRVFLDSMRESEKQVPYAVNFLGSVDDRRWLCLCRTELRESDIIQYDGDSFAICTAVPVYAGKELSHWWAILMAAREAG